MKKTAFELVAEAREKHGITLDPSLPRSELVKQLVLARQQNQQGQALTEMDESEKPEPEPLTDVLFSGKKPDETEEPKLYPEPEPERLTTGEELEPDDVPTTKKKKK